MQIAEYCRVSTDQQELVAQVKTVHEFAMKKYPEASHYIAYQDITSGTKQSRPDFDRLFEDAHRRAFDHLIFYDLSRFGRTSVQFTFQKLWELENLGITWESYYEPYLSTMGMFKEAMISIITSVNKLQRDLISQKTKEKLDYLKANGKVLGRPKGSKDKQKRRRKNYMENTNAMKNK